MCEYTHTRVLSMKLKLQNFTIPRNELQLDGDSSVSFIRSSTFLSLSAFNGVTVSTEKAAKTTMGQLIGFQCILISIFDFFGDTLHCTKHGWHTKKEEIIGRVTNLFHFCFACTQLARYFVFIFIFLFFFLFLCLLIKAQQVNSASGTRNRTRNDRMERDATRGEYDAPARWIQREWASRNIGIHITFTPLSPATPAAQQLRRRHPQHRSNKLSESLLLYVLILL